MFQRPFNPDLIRDLMSVLIVKKVLIFELCYIEVQ